MPCELRYLANAKSDQGFARSSNEDRVLNRAELGLFGVIDGMGGQAGGERAAEIAAKAIEHSVETARPGAEPEELLREAIARANNEIFGEASRNRGLEGMGCVLTIALLGGGRLHVGHVGDSRMYRFRHRRAEKLTHDHSPVGEMEDEGNLTEADAMGHPMRNEVFRDVGTMARSARDSGFIEYFSVPFDAGCGYLLCTDGLTDVVARAQILAIVDKFAGDPGLLLDALIERANEASKDNVSAAWIETDGFPESFRLPEAPQLEVITKPEDPEPDPLPQVSVPVAMPPRRRYWSGWLLFLTGAALGAAAFQPAVTGWVNQLSRHVQPPAPTPSKAVSTKIKAGQSDQLGAVLAKSKKGDVVELEAGEYETNIHVPEGIAIVGDPGHGTILRAADASESAVVVAGVAGVTILNLTIDADGAPRGIEVSDAAVEIAGCDVSGASGAGIRIRGSRANVAIHGTRSHDNGAEGIRIEDRATAAVEIDQGAMRAAGGQGLKMQKVFTKAITFESGTSVRITSKAGVPLSVVAVEP